MEDQFPTAGCRIHAFLQTLKPNLARGERIDRFDQMFERSAEPVQFPNDQGIPLACIFQSLGQAFARIDGTAGDIAENLFAAVLLESVFLQVRILVGGGNPSIANPHTIPLSQNAAVVSGFEMLISRQVLQQLWAGLQA